MAYCEGCADLQRENGRLSALLNTPELHDFSKAVVLEAAHQRERWPEGHDANKSPEDWFWLIGYLAGKALRPDQPIEKRLHRIITIAAAAANWHAAALSAQSPVAGRESSVGDRTPDPRAGDPDAPAVPLAPPTEEGQ